MAVCPNGHDSASDDFCDICGMRIGGSPSPAAAGPASAAEPCPRCGTARSGQFCESCGYNFAGPRFTPSAPPAAAPPAPRGYSQPTPSSTPSPGPTPSPDSGGYSSRQPPPPAPPLQQPSSAHTIPPTPAASPVPSGPPPPREASPSASSFPYPLATWTAVVGADRAYYEQVQAASGAEGATVAFPSYCAERRFQLVGNQMRIGRRSVSRGLSPEIDLTGPPADPGISRLHAVLVATPDGGWAVLDPGSANGTLVNGSEIGVGDQVTLHDGDRINLGAWTAITVHRG